MTDNEIIKALECCKKPAGTGACKNCPLDKDRPCTTTMMESALDLINRQQAEIENYIKVAEYQQNLTLKKSFEIKELKAEIERLEIKIEGVQEANAILREHIKKAVKEFAERLRAKAGYCVAEHNGQILYETKSYSIKAIDLDNLVKEMVGDAE